MKLHAPKTLELRTDERGARPASPPRTTAPPIRWSVAALLLIALSTMGASWSCGPLFTLTRDGGDPCDVVAYAGDDGRARLGCLDELPRACRRDADCGDAEHCQRTGPCLLGPPCREGVPCPVTCPGVCTPNDSPCEDPPVLCMSDDACAPGSVCNAAELCLRPPGCGPDDFCPHVCWGVCEPASDPDSDPSEPTCFSDQDCDDGLVCNAGEVCLSPPGCSAELACPAVCAGYCVAPSES